MFLKKLLFLALPVIIASCSTAKRSQTKINSVTGKTAPVTSVKDTTKKSTIKLYKDVVTDKAITDDGFIKVHKIEDRYLFEIPNTVLSKDILIANRISQGAPGQGGMFGHAGDPIGDHVVRFEKGPNNKLFMKKASYVQRSSDSSDNGMYRAVARSNVQPIIASFDIKAFSPDSAGIVIDLTDFIASDNTILYFEKKSYFQIGALQTDKSYIDNIKAFSRNIEIATTRTYAAASRATTGDNAAPSAGTTTTFDLNTSLMLLPEQPMRPRYNDSRVGYFSIGYLDFDADPQGVATTTMINRWRLEPKPEDIQKYKRGELVEPQKPIVYYIDPATPKKWVPYLMQGVNDWQKAFEKAGFKNAIYALEAPVNDPEWSLSDAAHNVIVYKPSEIANAQGPHIHDPRSGEILETHIHWYHNVMSLLRNWYMLQAGPSDPRARTIEFDEELMGQLIRFVSSHEVGHTLGLMHNFGASSTIPVEKLRDKKWVEENGFCPSIMDYARFNYIAQPEDCISPKGLMPRIGVYDEWAIEWGYKWLPEFNSIKEEKAYMNKWIIQGLEKDNRLWFGSESNQTDPRRQSEDLGDNAMKAGIYGIRNLKYVLEHLPEWTSEPNEDNTALKNMHAEVIQQYQRYIGHVLMYIGGEKYTEKTKGQKGVLAEYISKKQQKEAVQFLHREVFETPIWLKNKKVLDETGRTFLIDPLNLQIQLLVFLTNNKTFTRLLRAETIDPANAYTVDEFLQDLETGIWKELKTKSSIDLYRRNLQRVYADRLLAIVQLIAQGPYDAGVAYNYYTDVVTIAKARLHKLLKLINAAIPFYAKDEMSKNHLMDLKERIEKVFNNRKPDELQRPWQSGKAAMTNFQFSDEIDFKNDFDKKSRRGCWDDNMAGFINK